MTMLALLALVSDPNLGLFSVGFILTGIVALIGGIRVKRLLRGIAKDKKDNRAGL